jgi:competence protein ComGC
MALAGDIKEFGLADIFQIVSLQKKTGTLTIESATGKVTVLLEKGLIVGADATFRPIEERLEQALVRSQQISKFQLTRAKEAQKKTLQPLWTALAETGGIDLSALQKALAQQIHETVYQVLRWTEGQYRFEPRKSVEYDRRLIFPINTEFLIMEGFRITDEWSELEKEISSLQLIVRRTSGPPASQENLSEAERKVYNLLTTEKTIQEMIDSSQLGEFDTCQTIYELIRKNLVEKVRGKKGKIQKVRQLPFNVKDAFLKAVTLLVGIGFLVGIVLLFKYLPENFALIHKPNIKALEYIKQFTSRSQLNNLSPRISLYFLEHGKLPRSFNDLLEQGFIASKTDATDLWGREYIMTTETNTVVIRSLGQDGKLNTDDDVSIEISF